LHERLYLGSSFFLSGKSIVKSSSSGPKNPKIRYCVPLPAEISTSCVERSHLSLRMSNKRFARLSNGFSKRIENHCAAVSLYVAFYNLVRVHEALRITPAVALGIADRVWTIADLIDAALATQPIAPTPTAPDRRRRFRVVEGGKL
jgi:hypothetical protein